MCQEGVKSISKEDGLMPDERLRLSGFHHWESYFKKKVAIAMDEVDNIFEGLMVTSMPSSFPLRIQPPHHSSNHVKSPHDTAKCRGLGRRSRKRIVTTKQITQRNSRFSCILRIAASESENPSLAKAYPYLGPWQFPRNFPKHEATAAQMYNMLVDIWGSYYNGYEIEMKNLGQDSSAGSQNSRGTD
ncbi:hypothetical protein EMPG_16762 [Blastomyces silverae]|uniref:Uncharacterized protein n=1 Tax=Blastomyces silverae TaxID=2060906 RepID=A0A0H1B9R2_9EURO|nr:hypothetical protein EMPG_16762 [Blastomyces silverae]